MPAPVVLMVTVAPPVVCALLYASKACSVKKALRPAITVAEFSVAEVCAGLIVPGAIVAEVGLPEVGKPPYVTAALNIPAVAGM